MWKLTLKLEKENSYVTETLEFTFEKYGQLCWFLGEALENSVGKTKAVIEYQKKEKEEKEGK